MLVLSLARAGRNVVPVRIGRNGRQGVGRREQLQPVPTDSRLLARLPESGVEHRSVRGFHMAAGLKPLAELLVLEQQHASGLPADDQRAGGQVTDEILPVVQCRRIERADIADERFHRGAFLRIPGRIGRQHGLYFRFRIHGSRFSALSVQRPPFCLTTNRSRTDI